MCDLQRIEMLRLNGLCSHYFRALRTPIQFFKRVYESNHVLSERSEGGCSRTSVNSDIKMTYTVAGHVGARAATYKTLRCHLLTASSVAAYVHGHVCDSLINSAHMHVFQAPFKRHSPGQEPFKRNSSRQAPFKRHSPDQAPFKHHSPGQAPFKRHSPGQAPFKRHSPGQAPFKRHSPHQTNTLAASMWHHKRILVV